MKHNMHRIRSIEQSSRFLICIPSTLIIAQRFNAGEIEHHNERVPAGTTECFISAVPAGTRIAL
jgi:hypothetical protein